MSSATLCVCVFWSFFGECSVKPSVCMKLSWLCADLFLSEDWFSCLRDSHIVNEGTGLSCLCMMFLFPG